jgi:hypothetical protein
MTAHHHKQAGQDPFASDLVPLHLDYGATAPFIYETITAFQYLNEEPPVRQFARAEPEAVQAIRALCTAVTNAGIRVRDGGKAKILDEHLSFFTAEEIWMIDLAVDVVAMFAYGGGLRSETQLRVHTSLRSVDKHRRDRHWKREVHKAGTGPDAFRELRAQFPHHEPRD